MSEKERDTMQGGKARVARKSTKRTKKVGTKKTVKKSGAKKTKKTTKK